MLKCWLVSRRQALLRYVTGDLTNEEQRRIEDHFLDCGRCRDRVARLRAGNRFAAQLSQVKPPRDVWDAIETALDRTGDSTPRQIPRSGRPAKLRAIVRSPHFGLAALALALLLGVTLVVSSRRGLPEPEPSGLKSLEAVDWHEFSPVRINEIQRNTKPHVVAEGYVSEVRVNDEDGDLSFRLVDDLGQQQRFIVCEIIDPIRLTPPAVGSRVRVYGVSRYDGERDHNWYEVHPVLNIEVLR